MPEPTLRIPVSDREAATAPALATWSDVLERNRARTRSWTAEVCGVPIGVLRERARRETLEAASVATERLDGVRPRDADAPIVVTGHQPLLYHPGIWAKVFLAERFARDLGGVAVECVIDTDGIDRVSLPVPCAGQRVERCVVDLATPVRPDAYFAALQAPSALEVARFEEEGRRALDTLGLPAVAENFGRFCSALTCCVGARNLAEAVTGARRQYELPAGLDYLALPISDQAATTAFAAFVADIAMSAERFADAHNAALAEHRALSGMRTAGRPFPDLRAGEDGVELPFWHLDGRTRASLWARRDASGVAIRARGEVLARLSLEPDCEGFVHLEGSVAPRAVALTLFNRVLVSDLFVHGAGGAGYDVVTDEIIRRFWAIEPPEFVAATLTLRLPLALTSEPESEERLSELRQRLRRLEHNPDEFVDRLPLRSSERDRMSEMVEEKARLLEEIATPGADKKSLGRRIRDTNAVLARAMEPLLVETRDEIARIEDSREEAAVLTDRTYPFCLWDPCEVRDILT